MNFHAKRIVSTLCALAMLAAMIPSAALADDTVTAPASSAIAVETPAPDVQEEPDVSIDTGNTDPAPEETPGEVPTPTPTETPEEEPIEEPDENPEAPAAEVPEETPSPPLAEEPTQGQEDNSAQAPQGNGSTVDDVEQEYIITPETTDIKTVLKNAKTNGKNAKICTGTYTTDFTVEDSHNGASTAENIAMGPADASTVISAWSASSGHCANMVNSGFTRGAIVHIYDGDGCHFWCATFG